jgi:hypothetical protein
VEYIIGVSAGGALKAFRDKQTDSICRPSRKGKRSLAGVRIYGDFDIYQCYEYVA